MTVDDPRTEPRSRVGVGWIGGLVLANLGLYMAFLTPIQVLLAEQIDDLTPSGKEVALGWATGVGALVAVVANPLAGALSDRTVGRFGHAAPVDRGRGGGRRGRSGGDGGADDGGRGGDRLVPGAAGAERDAGRYQRGGAGSGAGTAAGGGVGVHRDSADAGAGPRCAAGVGGGHRDHLGIYGAGGAGGAVRAAVRGADP